jgi:hypothetical protein
MKKDEPRKPEGDDEEAAFMQWVWEKLARELKFGNSPTVRFNQTTKGITAEAISKGGGSIAPSTSVKMFAIKTLSGADYFVANELTFTSVVNGILQFTRAATDTYIAKPVPLRKSIASETIDGIAITYYTPGNLGGLSADNNRTASDGTNTESQVVYPRYVAASTLVAAGAIIPANSQCVVFAIQVAIGTGLYIPASTNQITWLEVPDIRVWCRRFTQ